MPIYSILRSRSKKPAGQPNLLVSADITFLRQAMKHVRAKEQAGRGMAASMRSISDLGVSLPYNLSFTYYFQAQG